jgi:DNA-binding transcriptional LysR family regulator
MELHQIRYFLALCEELNFTRAAERCMVAQSSLTRAIKALETELGGPLFHRERANTHLSRLGEKVKPFLEQAYGNVRDAQRQAQDFARAQTAALRIGLMRTIAPAQLIGLVAAIRARHPDVALQIADAPALALQERLIGGELDAAIYALPGLPADARLSHRPLYREPFVIAVNAAHRFAQRSAIRLKDLHGEPYLWRLHCEHEQAADEAFAEAGVSAPPVFQSDRDEWVLAMVAAGLGYALMPAHSAEHPGVVALPLIEPELSRDIAFVTARGRSDAATLGALLHDAMRARESGAPLHATAVLADTFEPDAIARLYRTNANTAFP